MPTGTGLAQPGSKKKTTKRAPTQIAKVRSRRRVRIMALSNRSTEAVVEPSTRPMEVVPRDRVEPRAHDHRGGG